ncbi:MAG: protein kinase [bacterium]|nr:protein kinase [bacterium]
MGWSVGPYRVLRKVGEGGQGIVYEGVDERTARPVAIKALSSKRLARDVDVHRFRREVRLLRQLSHPGLCQIVDFIEKREADYVVMPFIPGETLLTHVRRASLRHREGWTLARARARLVRYAGPRDPEGDPSLVPILWLTEQVADAVAAAHALEIVHRDLKPGNIIVSSAGAPIVLDFGLGIDLSEPRSMRLSRPGQQIGTPGYMSPEQVDGDPERVSPRSDVYALGVILYELLTLTMPHGRSCTSTSDEAVRGGRYLAPRERAPELPRAVEDVCMHALEPDPGERYASAAEMARDLRSLQRARPVSITRGRGRRAHVRHWRRWHGGELRRTLLELAGLWLFVFLIAVLAAETSGKLDEALQVVARSMSAFSVVDDVAVVEKPVARSAGANSSQRGAEPPLQEPGPLERELVSKNGERVQETEKKCESKPARALKRGMEHTDEQATCSEKDALGELSEPTARTGEQHWTDKFRQTRLNVMAPLAIAAAFAVENSEERFSGQPPRHGEAPPFVPIGDGEDDADDSLLGETRVRLFDRRGNPAGGVRVTWMQDGAPVAIATAGADGAATCSMPIGKRSCVLAGGDRFATEAEWVEALAPGELVDLGTLVLRPARSIRGWAVDAQGMVLRRVRVVLLPRTTEGDTLPGAWNGAAEALDIAWTDGEGAFELRGADGVYRVAAIAGASRSNVALVTVAGSDVRDVTLQMQQSPAERERRESSSSAGGARSGALILALSGPQGEPLRRMRVRLWSDVGDLAVGMRYTDRRGRVAWDELEPGRYSPEIVTPDQPGPLQPTLTGVLMDAVRVAPERRRSIALETELPMVRVRIAHAASEHAGVWVGLARERHLTRHLMSLSGCVRSDADGFVDLIAPEPGRYVLYARAGIGSPATTRRVAIGQGGNAFELELADGRVQGWVQSGGSASLANVRARLAPRSSKAPGAVTVSSGVGATPHVVHTNQVVASADANGALVFEHVPAGEYWLEVESSAHLRVEPVPVTVGEGATTVEPIPLVPACRLEVKLRGDALYPALTLVEVHREHACVDVASFDTNGVAVFQSLAPGAYEVVPLIDGERTPAHTVTVNENAVAELRLPNLPWRTASAAR